MEEGKHDEGQGGESMLEKKQRVESEAPRVERKKTIGHIELPNTGRSVMTNCCEGGCRSS